MKRLTSSEHDRGASVSDANPKSTPAESVLPERAHTSQTTQHERIWHRTRRRSSKASFESFSVCAMRSAPFSQISL